MRNRCLRLLSELSVLLLLPLIAAALNNGACIQWCPPNPPCVNANACHCAPGLSSAPRNIFTGHLESCNDIKACGPDSKASCGVYLNCQDVNKARCKCPRDYYRLVSESMPSIDFDKLCDGLFDQLRLTWRAAVENLKAATPEDCAWWCPLNSICVNATACRCAQGFSSSSGEILTNIFERCDVYELKTTQKNVVSSLSNMTWTSPRIHVLEKSSKQKRLPSEQGSERRHHQEPLPHSGKYTGISFPHWTARPGINSKRLDRFFNRIDDLVRDSKSASAAVNIQKFIQVVDDLLETPEDLETKPHSEKNIVANNLLLNTEHILKRLTESLPNDSLTLNTAGDTKLSLKMKKQEDKNVNLSVNQAKMLLNWDTVQKSNDSGPLVVGLISTPGMGKLLAEAPVVLETEEQAVLQETHKGLLQQVSTVLLSDVISVFVNNNNTQQLSSPVSFIFNHSVTPGPRQTVFCVFWEHGPNESGYWSTNGCWIVDTRDTSTTCQCTHLSSFAILMAYYDVQEDAALAVITSMGLSLSLLCLLLAALTFLLCKAIQNTSTSLHLQLSLCLFLAHLLFLMAIDRTEPKVLCTITAGALHYLYLASFTWMLLEGLNLFLTARNLMVVNYSNTSRLMKKFMFPVGYGVPAVIVAISAVSRPHLYGTPTRCWLNTKKGFIWTFLGPVCIIFSINLAFFLMTFWLLKNKLSSLNRDVSTLQNTRMLTFKAIAQLFILGCTWCLGILQVGPAAQAMAYLFTIINSLQGVFIFLVYCLLSQQVREQYWKWLKGFKKTDTYSEGYTFSSKAMSEVCTQKVEN
ncbi:adhesion G protein-coupled receptor E2-like [Molossus nigricans]